MTAVPALGFPSNSSRTQGDMKTYEETMLSLYKECLGGSPKQTLTLNASGQITPVAGCSFYAIDTFSSAAADDMDNFVATNLHDGQLLAFTLANNARIVTNRHNQGASLNFQLVDNANFVIESTKDFIAFAYSSSGSGTLTELFRSDQLRINRLLGAQSEVVTGIVGDTFTPTAAIHSLTCESGNTDNLGQIAQTTPYLNFVITHPENVGDVITNQHNTGGAGKLLNKSGAHYAQTHPNEFTAWLKKGSTWEEWFTAPTHPIDYIFSGGRISVHATQPVWDNNGTNLYLHPYGEHGQWLSGYRGGKWIASPLTSILNIALPNVKFCGGWLHGYLGTDNRWNLEIERWDNGSPVTGSVTSVTIGANPVVTTGAAHGLSVGDRVAFDGGGGTAFTDSARGLNSAAGTSTAYNIFHVTATPSGTQFTLGGWDTSGLSSSTANWYKIAAPTALALQDGVRVKGTDSTRRALGAFLTHNTAGQAASYGVARFVVSLLNRVAMPCGNTTPAAMTLNSNGVYVPIGPDKRSMLRWLEVDRGLDQNRSPVQLQMGIDITNAGASYVTAAISLDNLTAAAFISPELAQQGNGLTWKASCPWTVYGSAYDNGAHFACIVGKTSASQNNTVTGAFLTGQTWM